MQLYCEVLFCGTKEGVNGEVELIIHHREPLWEGLAEQFSTKARRLASIPHTAQTLDKCHSQGGP